MSEQESPERKAKAQKRRKRVLGVVVLFFLLWGGFTWYGQQSALATKAQELTKVQSTLQQVKLQNDELAYQVNKLNDREYIAEIARKDYHLSKPGEVIFITPDK
jgi:cell division protein DivIC